MPKLFLLDMDGTMIDSNGIWKDVDIRFLARRGMEYSKAYYEGVAHTIFPLAAQFTKEFCSLEESCEEIMQEWMDLAQGLYSTVSIKAGVRAFLDQCRQHGITMVLVTSSVPEHCRTAMAHLGLTDYFESIVFAQELGLEKKDPEIWRTVASRHDTAPVDCLVLDDSLSACKGAKAAGMQVIGVYDHFFAADEEEMRCCCDRYIHSFEELLEN